MWLATLVGGIGFGMAYPAFGVYRGELFPTTDRSFASGMITAASLIGGSIGLIVAGTWLDSSRSYGGILALFAIGPTLVALFVVRTFPETAHKELEEISNQTFLSRPTQ
jgi:MFS family permease